MLGNSSPELMLHVGLPKTGTKAIQRYMYFNREALAKQGVFWAETYPRSNPSSNDWAHHIHSHKWGGWLDPRTFPVTPDEAWKALGRSIQIEGGRHVVSSEWFSAVLPTPNGKEMLKFIAEIVAPARLKVIAYVRRHDELSESHFREILKERGSLITVDDYISRNRHVTFMYLGRGLELAVDMLGKENVIVRVYNPKRLRGGDSVSDFLDVCEFPKISGSQGRGGIVNQSFKTLACKVISDPRVIEMISEDNGRFNVLRNFLNQQKFGRFDKSVLLDTTQRRDIMRHFSADAAKARNLLSENDAKVLEFDAGASYRTIQGDDLLLTREELIELQEVLGLRNGTSINTEHTDELVLTYKGLVNLIVSTWSKTPSTGQLAS